MAEGRKARGRKIPADHVSEAGNPPLCDLCVDDDMSAAVKFCNNCGVLYCKKCLSAHHPLRGAMKQHKLMSVSEYWETKRGKAERAAGGGGGAAGGAEKTQEDPICKRHQQSFCSYCMDCQELICTRCVSAHIQHNLTDIHQAYIVQRGNFERKTKKMEDMRDKIHSTIDDFKQLMKEVDDREAKYKEQTEKTYNEAVAALEAWRRDALQEVDDKHRGLERGCDRVMELLHLKMAENDRAERNASSQAIAEELMSSGAAASPTSESNPATSDPGMTSESGSSIAEEPIPTALFDGPNVSKPLLKFTRTSSADLCIREHGFVIQGENIMSADAWTDGAFQTGQYYWEVTLTVIKNGPRDESCPCRIGLVANTEDAWDTPGSQSWGIGVSFSDYFKCHGLGQDTDVRPAYQKWRQVSGHVPLGFSLDCEAGTLTVVDRSCDQLIATVRDVLVSTPLIPAVRMCGDVTLFVRLEHLAGSAEAE